MEQSLAEKKVRKRKRFPNLFGNDDDDNVEGENEEKNLDLMREKELSIDCGNFDVGKGKEFQVEEKCEESCLIFNEEDEVADVSHEDAAAITKAAFDILLTADSLKLIREEAQKILNPKPQSMCISCSLDGKNTPARFGLAQQENQYCKKHHNNEIHVNNFFHFPKGKQRKGFCVECKEIGVTRRASYGLLSDNVRLSCGEHRKPEQSNLCILLEYVKQHMQGTIPLQSSKWCIVCLVEGVEKQPSFGVVWGKRFLCASHRDPSIHSDVISVKPNCFKCEEDGDHAVPRFNLPTEKKGKYCFKHADLKVHVNVHACLCITCKLNGIRTCASFGDEGDKKLLFCVKHRDAEKHVSINQTVCVVCKSLNLRTSATFGSIETGKRIHCLKHKTDSEVSLNKAMCSKCEEEGKRTRATFGDPFIGRLMWCFQHRDPQKHINLHQVLCIKCEQLGIRRSACYGFESDQKKILCAQHCDRTIHVNFYKMCVECELNGVKKHAHRDGLCHTCHPNFVEKLFTVSLVGCQWIDQLQKELLQTIQHSHYNLVSKSLDGKECRLPCCPNRPVDGFTKNTNEVFEFLGNRWHGHKSYWPQTMDFAGRLYRDLFKKTEEKFEILRSNGYKVYYIWESEFHEWKKNGTFSTLISKCRFFEGTLKCACDDISSQPLITSFATNSDKINE